MKLSEAILAGCACHPQGFNTMFEFEVFDYTLKATCALGAAYEGLFGCQTVKPETAWYDPLYEHYPELRANGFQLERAITHRNDMEHESRETIALWLQEQGL